MWKQLEEERRLRGEGTKKVMVMARRPLVGKEKIGQASGPQSVVSLTSQACLLPLRLAI